MIEYHPPSFLFNAHLETIYPAIFRRVKASPFVRERIETPDQDFLDLDWGKQGSKKVVIVSHGLEGNSSRAYVQGMTHAFFEHEFDTVAWNYRGCGDEMNRQPRFYHSGATDDLDVVVRHIAPHYEEIYLVGFSLGGNITLKYLGERTNLSPLIRKAAVFSVPMDLHTSCLKIGQPSNYVYSRRFLRHLKKKVVKKGRTMPAINLQGIEKIKTLEEFDDRYTAPLHGFQNAIDYYSQCSSLGYVERITIPTLIVNAANDPFLSPECYPIQLLDKHPFVKLEVPRHGGHVGFTLFNKNGLYWSELRALDFFAA
jgi:hypothetical protein